MLLSSEYKVIIHTDKIKKCSLTKFCILTLSFHLLIIALELAIASLDKYVLDSMNSLDDDNDCKDCSCNRNNEVFLPAAVTSSSSDGEDDKSSSDMSISDTSSNESDSDSVIIRQSDRRKLTNKEESSLLNSIHKSLKTSGYEEGVDDMLEYIRLMIINRRTASDIALEVH